MAETLVHTIQFLEDNPYGTFVAGDVVTIFYDPDDDPSPELASTTGYHVYNNDVEIFSGGDVFFESYSYKIETSAQAQICNATTLVQSVRQISNFPYVFSYVEPNHPSCAVDPETCDLLIAGVPLVRSASGATEADGEITITATSSNSIQYKLGSTFIYNDGTAQPSGHFSALLPGQYRIYVRDSKNCSTDILVDVPYNDTYSPYLRVEYDDYTGGVTRVDVVKRDYSGSVTEVKGGDIPFERSLRREGSLNKFEPILATQATLRIISETNYQFQALYNNNPEEFRLNYYKFSETSEAAFTPAELPALTSWTNIAGDGLNWNPATQQVDFSGADFFAESDLYHTAYTFETGRAYSFDFSVTGRNIFGGAGPGAVITLMVVNSSFESLLEKVVSIPYANPQNASGTFEFIAPTGATGLAIHARVDPSASSFIIKVDSFVNNTESIAGDSGGFRLNGVYKVLPQQYSEMYKAPPYYVDVVATDGLPSLKDYAFLQDDGQRFNRMMKQIELVAFILSKTKLKLNIRVACNLYATDMDQTDSDDPLDQAHVDTDRYYLEDEDPSLEYVLQAILEPYGASILQEDGRWNIVRVEEKRGEYDYREFDYNGIFITHGSFDPVIDVDSVSESNRMVWSDQDQNMELRPGYGKIMVHYKLGLKPNILENGNFRLKSVYNSSTGTYSYAVDKFGFQVVNAGYPLNETFESIDDNNIALVLKSGASITTGEAYILSDTYNIKMGIQNQLKIGVRFKIPKPPVSVPYQKVRMRVQYGTKYLQSNGLWTTDVNELTFFNDKFDEYVENEIIAESPDNGAADGYDFSVRLYQSYVYHAEHTTFNSLTDIDAEDLPTGTKTQIVSTELNRDRSTIYFYELQESKSTNYIEIISSRGNHDASGGALPSSGGSGSGGAIARGDYWTISVAGNLEFDSFDYTVNVGDKLIALVDGGGTSSEHWRVNYAPEVLLPQSFVFGTDTKQWALKGVANTVLIQEHVFSVDSITVQFLNQGVEPVDTIVREIKAEPRNLDTFEKEVIHGSYSSVIVTNTLQRLGIDRFSRFANTLSSLVTTNVLSADLIYSGYLRDSAGNGFETWTRDGIAESSSLHAILLQSYAAQYKRSWRKITGSLYSNDRYMSFLNVLREVRDGNRLYMPIALTIDDKRNKYNGEFLELIDITADAGSNGSGTSPFSRAYSNAYGAGYE